VPWLVVAALIAPLVLEGCQGSQDQGFKDYVYDTYYSTLAKARGDRITEWTTLAKTVDATNLPRTNAKQLEMLPLLETWIKTATEFESKTKKDDSDSRLKPLRDKYLQADNFLTYALTEFWTALDPTLSMTVRRDHLSESAAGYQGGSKSLTEAHAMAERFIYGR
jgi:hypothetical protein